MRELTGLPWPAYACTREEFAQYVASRPPNYYRTGIRLHHDANGGHGDSNIVNDMNTWWDKGWRQAPGYHVQIDPTNGQIYILAPMEGKANHIGDGYNTEEIAVCLQGNYDVQSVTPGLLDTLRFVCHCISDRYQVDPHPGFHRDVDSTDCPGYNITHELINAAVDGAGFQPPVIAPPAAIPAPDLSFKTKPLAPTQFAFIQGGGECLGEGDESPQVRDMEMGLLFVGWLPFTPNTYKFDGDDTAAVSAFQVAYCPPADGIYGVNTAVALQRAIDRRYTGMPALVTPPHALPPFSPPTPVPTPPVVIPPTPVTPAPVPTPIPQPTPVPTDDTPGWFVRFIQALGAFLAKIFLKP